MLHGSDTLYLSKNPLTPVFGKGNDGNVELFGTCITSDDTLIYGSAIIHAFVITPVILERLVQFTLISVSC